MRVSWLWICLAGCGRLQFDARGDALAIDAVPIDLAPPSSTVLGPPLMIVDVTALGPFPVVGTVVSELSSSFEDDDPTLTRDELEIWFESNRGGTRDIWTSRRANVTDPWPTPTAVSELNTVASEEHPFVTADGLRIYFMSSRTGDNDLYVAARADRDSPWENITVLTQFNSAFEEDMGCVSGDEKTLMFSSKRLGSTDDLYVARRSDPSEPWGPPQLVTELMSMTYERQPHLDDYARVIYYETNSFADLRFRQRADANSTWGPAELEPTLDVTNWEESDPWLSPDLRRLYYTTFMTASQKDIYLATR